MQTKKASKASKSEISSFSFLFKSISSYCFAYFDGMRSSEINCIKVCITIRIMTNYSKNDGKLKTIH